MGSPAAGDHNATVDEVAQTAADAGPVAAPSFGSGQLTRGAAIGRYLVLSLLGAGGMGVVYAAYDPDLDRKVAIKLLRPQQRKSPGSSSGRIRLLREAQALARLSHPNVTAVYDVGTAYDQVFVAMEFIDGCTLRQWLYTKQRTVAEIVGVFRRAGQGLLAAHNAGMVHRDFKPDNVLVGGDGQVRVSDFGLARALRDPGESQEGTAPLPDLVSESPREDHRGLSGEQALMVPITKAGTLLGTPRYMAPEQFRGDITDQRTDVFSFCVALWEAVYGAHPFGEGNLQELCLAVTLGKLVAPPAQRPVPTWLHRILVRGLAAEPALRYQSMQPLLRDLTRDRQRLRLRAAAVTMGVLLLALGLWAGRAFLHRNERLCQGSAQHLDEVWNEAVKALLRDALLATHHPQAEGAAQRVIKELDLYTAQWKVMRIEACIATHVRGVQSAALLDLRMQCLDRRLQEVAALTQELRSVDRVTIERVVSSRYDFTPTAACADVAALRMPVPLPERPEVRAKVEALYRELAILKAQDFSGRYAEMAPRARAALTTAQAIGYAPAEALAAYTLAKVEFRSGDLASAERDFERTAGLALRSQDGAVLAQTLTFIHHIVGVIHQQYDQALVWQELAAAAIDRCTEAARSRPQLLSDSCVVATGQGRHNEAVPLCQQAVALQAQFTGAESPEVAAYLNNLASAYRHAGRFAEALAEYQHALKILVQHRGRQHPLATMTLRNWARLLYDTGQIKEAAVRYNESLLLVEQRFGAQDPRLLEPLTAVVMAEQRLGHLSEAQSGAKRMILIAEKTFGEKHEKTASAYNALAKVLHGQGRRSEALALYERARPLLEQAKNTEALVENLIGAANCLREMGKPGEALPLLERTRLLLKPGMDELLDPDAQYALARTLWALGGHKVRATTAALQARSGYTQAGALGREPLAEVTQWLAQHVGE